MRLCRERLEKQYAGLLAEKASLDAIIASLQAQVEDMARAGQEKQAHLDAMEQRLGAAQQSLQT